MSKMFSFACNASRRLAVLFCIVLLICSGMNAASAANAATDRADSTIEAGAEEVGRIHGVVILGTALLMGIILGIAYIIAGMRSISLNRGLVMSIIGFDEMWRYIPLVVCGVLLIAAAIFNLVEMIFIKKTADNKEVAQDV